MFKNKVSASVILIVVLFLFLESIPFFVAGFRAGTNYIFGGFLLNPVDGNSYLAKMYEGVQGSWLFTLPYTPQAKNGSFLMVYYLLLGHFAGWSRLQPVFSFHFFRLLGGLGLATSLYFFLDQFRLDQKLRCLIYLWGLIGSGLGWLFFPLFGLSPDFWVAEAYPFLSTYANPHFPLSLGILLFVFKPGGEGYRTRNLLSYFGWLLAGFSLVAISPFAFVLGITVLILFELISKRNLLFIFRQILKQRVTPLFLGGVPYLIYQFWVTRSNPELAAWNSQNITQTPGWWLLTIGLFPGLVWAILGAILVIRRKLHAFYLPTIWLVLSLVFIFIPWSLQRRFLIGIYVPIVILAGAAYLELIKTNSPGKSWPTFLFIGSLIFSIPTNLVVMASALPAINNHDLTIYLTRDEYEAFNWIKVSTPENSIFLASPQTGLLIPAWTGREVIYGHPFETIRATEAKEKVNQFFSQHGNLDSQEVLIHSGGVNYIFWGERERLINPQLPAIVSAENAELVYKNDTVRIYQITP